MNCADFDRRLDALLDGTCPPEDWRPADAHAAECARCRDLLDALGGRSEAGALDEAGQASLTASILAATSVRPCAAARERLCDYVDRTLAAFDRSLVKAHLERCGSCAALAGALARATAVLPTFAELAPPASLTGRVLAATSRRVAEPGSATGWPPGWPARRCARVSAWPSRTWPRCSSCCSWVIPWTRSAGPWIRARSTCSRPSRRSANRSSPGWRRRGTSAPRPSAPWRRGRAWPKVPEADGTRASGAFASG